MNSSLSSYLNLLRLLAALAVYLSHGYNFTKFRIPYVGNSGSEAVVVFFVLSGLLIAFSGMRQPDGGAFLRSRLVRLWSVCLPALLLTMVADTVGQYVSLAAYAPMQPYDLFKWAASIGVNAIFLNQVWHANIYPGTNGPFWSLSYEFWYYVIFAAAIYLVGKKKYVVLGCVALISGPAILIGFPIWLMGVLVYHAIARRQASALTGWLCWLGSLCGCLAFAAFNTGQLLADAFPAIAAGAKWKVDFWPESYLIGALVAINIYGFSIIARQFEQVLKPCTRVIRFGADISFGLYLFHYPLMYFTKALLYGAGLTSGVLFAGIVYTIPLAIAAFLAIQCEKGKAVVGELIDSFVNTVKQCLTALRGNRAGLLIDDCSVDGEPKTVAQRQGSEY